MEVKVTKCQNGHYFDSNKHANCPHCGAAEFTVNTQPSNKSGFGLFKKKADSVVFTPKRKTIENISPKPEPAIKIEDITPTDSQQAFVIEDVVTEGAFCDDNSLLQIENVETEGFFSNDDNHGDIDDVITEGFFSNDDNHDAINDDVITTGFFSNSETNVVDKEPASEFKAKEFVDSKPVQAPYNGNSLLEEIKNITADNDTKTVGVFSLGKNTSDNPNQNQIKDPAVGWIICVKGKNFGKDFKIVAGKNSIGRNETNDIAIENEESVSREKHAWIIYEPRKREFFVKPGESSGLTYLNDENIFDAKKLNSNDTLEFGDAKFVFIPLCGERFSWSDYIDKE